MKKKDPYLDVISLPFAENASDKTDFLLDFGICMSNYDKKIKKLEYIYF